MKRIITILGALFIPLFLFAAADVPTDVPKSVEPWTTILLAAEVVFLVGVLLFQVYLLSDTQKKIKQFKSVFTKGAINVESGRLLCVGEVTENLRNVTGEINAYLEQNKNSVADFNLIKDIVNRDLNSKEEEISTQLPFPLYLGLAGTMVGIILGLISFLINSNANTDVSYQSLLIGVAAAMATSFLGILFTTIDTNSFKNAQAITDAGKNKFLGTLEVELLPTLSTNLTSALSTLASNLDGFNTTFGTNATQLGDTLAGINEACTVLRDYVEGLQHLNITGITSANIEVYERLRNSSQEIGAFGQYVSRINEYLTTTSGYLSAVNALNERLDNSQARDLSIERMGAFFQSWETDIQARRSAMAEAVATLDSSLNSRINSLRDNSAETIVEVRNSTVEKVADLQDKMNQQVSSLSSALTERVGALQNGLTTQLETIQNAMGDISARLSQSLNELVDSFAGDMQDSLNRIRTSLASVNSTPGLSGDIKTMIQSLLSVEQENNAKLGQLITALSTIGNNKSGDRTPKWLKITCISTAAVAIIVLVLSVITTL